ncbi:MAG TPA: GlsB/YeaQ/YmgE family stress response membrane protein [Firmicutes bacterium]|nr:GlsB/YeaQ/YmgE family stress response membrane protein [Bacillota bacterium]
MGLVWFLLIGLAAGWLAGRIMKGKGFGLIGDLIVGVVGAVLGGWLFSDVLKVNVGAGIIPSLVVALIGAIILIWILRLIKKA